MRYRSKCCGLYRYEKIVRPEEHSPDGASGDLQPVQREEGLRGSTHSKKTTIPKKIRKDRYFRELCVRSTGQFFFIFFRIPEFI